MTTVLCVPGAFSFGNITTLETGLGGPQELLTQLGDNSVANIVPVTYNDWDVIGGAADGANKIDAAINAVPSGENIVVYGHSYGAVAACVWLRNQEALSQVSPGRLMFVNIGNSIRPNNGLSTLLGLYGGPGPVSRKFKVIDVARQFDKWADYCNVTSSPDYWQAVNNCNYGDMAPDSIHISYQDVRLNAPHAECAVGAVTFMLFETDPMPNPSGVTRAQLETAYNRIVAPTW
jgi:hypothetical protein